MDGGRQLTKLEQERWCLRKCQSCPACRYLSISHENLDCSYYNVDQCDFNDLVHEPAHYRTVDIYNLSSVGDKELEHRFLTNCVKSRPDADVDVSTAKHGYVSAATADLARLRLAIATLFVPAPDPCKGAGCAVLGWCNNARRLAATLGVSMDLVVITITDTEESQRHRGRSASSPTGSCSRVDAATERLSALDCPNLRHIHPKPRLIHAAQAHVRRAAAAARHRGDEARALYIERLGPTLYKWELIRHAEYDAVLFSDLDVELLPLQHDAALLRAEWATQLPLLVAAARGAPGMMVGSADSNTPLNSGLFWLFPPRDSHLYERGVAVLNAPYNHSHGYNLSGVPAQLFAGVDLRHADGGVLMYAGQPARIDEAQWLFGSAEVEQGFFLYMLYYLARVGRYVRRGGVHHVRHYVKDTGKPWNKVIDEELVVAAGPDHPPICNRRTMHRYSLLRTMRLAREQAGSACGALLWRALAQMDALNISCCSGFRSKIEADYGFDVVPVF